LIAVVKGEPQPGTVVPASPSEWLAQSYVHQSRNELELALRAARRAATEAPNFAFAWERVAELEFSFGQSRAALAALEKSLRLFPENAQGLTLKGYLLAAQNKISSALVWFDRAMEADSAVGNAWLGRGLCEIRLGARSDGLRDLLVAASLEPQRSVLRSYLGKAFADAGDDGHSNHELQLARMIDPSDPTAWLYTALLRQQENRLNEASSDLRSAQDRNDNRSLFRSRQLLDEDRAVGSANLASIYRDLGMNEVSVREAARAVAYDYANTSAHLFLSDAYNDLRDPTRFNLRYETVWFNELLLANILAPVGGGRLSQELSAQEYSKLFESDGFGLASSSDYRSDQRFRERAAQYGTFGNTAYSLDLDYQHNNGVRVNNNLDDIEWSATLKQQLTPADTALVIIQYENYHSGDNFQYYDPNRARPFFKFDEYEDPIVNVAWHHEWSPGMHTAALVGRLVNEQYFRDQTTPQFMLYQDSSGNITPATSPWDVNYHNTFEIYSAELNQICEWDRVTVSAGARYQAGSFQTQDLLDNPEASLLAPPPLVNSFYSDSTRDGFERISGYGYLTLELVEGLWLTGGCAYDSVRYPENFRNPPVQAGEDTRSQVGPKTSVVWSPVTELTVRGAYTRSLGGVSLDESYRLEPTQLAGFPQAFRSLVSESVVGSVAAPTYETIGLALDLKLSPRIFAGIEIQRLKTGIDRTIGAFEFPLGDFPAVVSSTPEQINYEERSLTLTLNQLLGDEFVVGASYKLTDSKLQDALPELPLASFPVAGRLEDSHLHEIRGYLLFNHRSGFFAEVETLWFAQENANFNPVEPGDSFFQQNFYAGYRFAKRRVELTAGILNVTGQNYRLEPLTIYQELPRKPVFEGRVKFEF
jgi:Tfp pilus assembly protein PilF